MHITGFGGVGEIGGNAFLVDDGRTRFFLDFGKQFGNDTVEHRPDGTYQEMLGHRPAWGDYFDDFVQPRTHSVVRDLMKLDLLPPMPQNYRRDVGGSPEPADIDFVVLSHAHIDHAGMIPYLKPEIPIVATDATRTILRSLQETQGGMESDFLSWTPRGVFVEGAKGGPVARSPDPPRIERPFLSGPQDLPGGWSAETFDIDHSIHGAMATCLRHPDHGELVYTGDFRMHGRKSRETERFVRAMDAPLALVIEGTRVHRRQDAHAAKETSEESDVEQEILASIERHAPTTRSGFVTVAYPPKDMDRLQSVWEAARRAGRTLLISPKQAKMLLDLRDAGLEHLPDPCVPGSGVQVYLPAKERAVILSEPGRPIPWVRRDTSWDSLADGDPEEWQLRMTQDYKGYERAVLARIGDNHVCARTVRQAMHAYLFSFSYWTITQLFDLFDDPAQADGLYIHSQTQPFNDDMEIQARKLKRWLQAFHLIRVDTHVSGHLSMADLDWVMDEIRPKTLVPVHSMAPDVTRDKFEAATGRSGVLLKHGLRARLC